MKYYFFTFFSSFLSAQFVSNNCENKILTEKEYNKCKTDSVYISDFQPRINYITSLTTKVLPKYRLIRKKTEFEQNLTEKINKLRKIYENETAKKLYTYQKDTYKSGMYVSPKSYVSTNLAFQNFILYPDTFALLINRNNLIVNPKSTKEEIDYYEKIITEIFNEISEKQKNQITTIVSELRQEKLKIQTDGPTEVLQGIGILNEKERNKYDIIDFLIWND